MNRQAFLGRLVRRGDLAIPQPPPRPDSPRGDLGEALLAMCAAGGCGTHRAQGPEAALARALALLAGAGVTRVGHSDLGPELMPLLPAAAKDADLELVAAADGDSGVLALGEPLAAGLTRCDLAVAQTGGLVQLAGAAGGRLMSLMPPVHVALLHREDVLPDMRSLARALNDPARFPAGPPAAALISGPSKTADIEGIMIKGVHGPGRLELVLWS